MSYRLKLHPEARADLRQIGNWIASFSGPDVASRKLDGIWGTIFSLPALPHRGNLQPDLGTGIRAIPSGEKAVITFQVDETAKRLTILVVSYGGQDWQSRLKSRL